MAHVLRDFHCLLSTLGFQRVDLSRKEKVGGVG